MSIYLYGILLSERLPQDAQPEHLGVGDPPRPVRILRHRALGALVSDVSLPEVSTENLRLMRRNMKAHAAVLNGLIAARTAVLPVRFGVVFPDERSLVAKVLDAQSSVLKRYLKDLDDAVEVTVKATYVEDRVLEQIVSEQPQLAAAPGRASRASYQSKLETGRRIAAAIQARRDQEGQWLVDKLRKSARAVRVNNGLNDLMVLNAAFLVDREKMPGFDKALERVHTQVGEYIKLNCVGPLPPYSFVDLRL